MGIHDFFIVYLIGAVAGGYYLCKIKKECWQRRKMA